MTSYPAFNNAEIVFRLKLYKYQLVFAVIEIFMSSIL
ncbi:hypothetical protein G753_02044 [Escherichia coli HVH 91 (4-4638751)]|nr:hypothetical protein G753_02044 [Escherichia coli HVH 91 (4-4638751)]GCP99159.1 hypothetical protein BvCmsHHNP005_04100 [Escherichia coli]SQL38373.1 Uncharacterised protein [Escherichia coli]SQL77251.1 Uncharacterised protein [Escherichia coli]